MGFAVRSVQPVPEPRAEMAADHLCGAAASAAVLRHQRCKCSADFAWRPTGTCYSLNPFTAKRPIKVPNLKSLRLFHPFT